MRIVLTGGTGFIGSAVLERLVDAGHHVTAVVRSHPSSLMVQDAGATGIIGDLFDAPWLAAELRQHDAAIHTASGGDERDVALNDAVLTAAIEAFGGTMKPFIHTGGVWTYGAGAAISEDQELRPPSISAWRLSGEQRILASGIKASIVAPGIVYGRGGGIPAMLAGAAENGALTLLGSGDQHWATVHVDDLAELYVLALDTAPGGRTYLGASGTNPTVRELGEALTADLTPATDEATLARLGTFGEALLLDQRATGERAKRELGWQPSRPSLTELLSAGYFSAA